MTTKNAVGNSLTGSTGSGTFVGATSPTLVTPALGVATATSITAGQLTSTADMYSNGAVIGLGGGSLTTNFALGINALFSNTSGNGNVAVGTYSLNSNISNSACVAIGYYAGQLSTADYSTYIGYLSGSTNTTGGLNTMIGGGTGLANGIGADLVTGSSNTLIGQAATTNDSATVGSMAIGRQAIGLKATGSTSGDTGPSCSIGSTGFPVGFRGDGSIWPSTTGAGFWRPVINGTAYMIPLITSGATGWPAITTSSITFNSTSGIIGTTTNDNAASGSVGQFISSQVLQASPVSLTTATPANVTSISLTAGDWDVCGNVSFIPGSSVVVTELDGWINSTSATAPDNSLVASTAFAAAGVVISNNNGFCVPQQRFSLSGTTTIYLSVSSVFSVGTLNVCGFISARRIR